MSARYEAAAADEVAGMKMGQTFRNVDDKPNYNANTLREWEGGEQRNSVHMIFYGRYNLLLNYG